MRVLTDNGVKFTFLVKRINTGRIVTRTVPLCSGTLLWQSSSATEMQLNYLRSTSGETWTLRQRLEGDVEGALRERVSYCLIVMLLARSDISSMPYRIGPVLVWSSGERAGPRCGRACSAEVCNMHEMWRSLRGAQVM